jgi:hydroxyethylthiazole kinase
MDGIYRIYSSISEKKPLVHHITNWVTIYDCANIARAFGALPVMAHAKEEVADMTGLASALVLNIGTLTPELVDSMLLAAKKANDRGIPVVLDAVGAGATPLRTDKAKLLIESANIGIIKGNLGEIATLAGAEAEVRGVESISADSDPKELAKAFAKEMGCTVVITGKEDFSSDGKGSYIVRNGFPMMGCVVGTGCMASSVIGSFAAVEKDYAKAAAAALSCFGIAGELAGKGVKGPGSFKEMLYDEVYNLSEEKINSLSKVEEYE